MRIAVILAALALAGCVPITAPPLVIESMARVTPQGNGLRTRASTSLRAPWAKPDRAFDLSAGAWRGSTDRGVYGGLEIYPTGSAGAQPDVKAGKEVVLAYPRQRLFVSLNYAAGAMERSISIEAGIEFLLLSAHERYRGCAAELRFPGESAAGAFVGTTYDWGDESEVGVVLGVRYRVPGMFGSLGPCEDKK